MARIRISQWARVNSVPSKYVVNMLNLVEPTKKHSPSSWVEIDRDSELFYNSVIDAAKLSYRSSNRN